MNKPYRVELFSDIIDVEENVATAEAASALYFKGMDSGLYHSGHVLSNETGEVLCHFSIEQKGNGIEISQWVAVYSTATFYFGAPPTTQLARISRQ